MKSGFVSIIGRPNSGKSTLLNRLVGEKISIVTDKPQTTRNVIRGIVTDDDGQVVFLDTPGIHKPIHKMNERMMKSNNESGPPIAPGCGICRPATAKPLAREAVIASAGTSLICVALRRCEQCRPPGRPWSDPAWIRGSYVLQTILLARSSRSVLPFPEAATALEATLAAVSGHRLKRGPGSTKRSR